MNNRGLKWLAGLCVVVVTAYLAAGFLTLFYIQARADLYSRELAKIREQESNFSRPLIFGDPFAQNAADWYRQVFAQIQPETLQAIASARADAATDLASPHLLERCGEIQSARLREALRSTRCDWQLGFGTRALTAGVPPRPAMAVSDCLILEGRRAARQRDPSAAARAYFESLAVAIDLGMGDDVMSLGAMASAQNALTALVKLAAETSDADLHDVWMRDLARVAPSLPDGRRALGRYRLILEDAVSLEELQSRGTSYGRYGSPIPNRIWSAWRLLRADATIRDLAAIEVARDRASALAIAAKYTESQKTTPGALVGAEEVRRAARHIAAGLDLKELHEAARVAIVLERWRTTHGVYPESTAATPLLARTELTYEPVSDGRGYRLKGSPGVLVDRPPQ